MKKDKEITNNKEVIYHLEDAVIMQKGALAQFAAGIFLAWSSMWTWGLFRIGFILASFLTLIPLVIEFLNNQLRAVLLTDEYLELKIGFNKKPITIPFSEIRKLKQENSKDFRNEECTIQTEDGKKYQIKSKYFPTGEFHVFSDKLNTVFLQQGKNKSILPKKNKPAPPPKDQISAVAQSNLDNMQEDLALKIALENNMQEAYESVYRTRDEFDLAKNPQANIVYRVGNEDGSFTYFLENDYLPNLAEENIEIGNNLITAALENLKIVETRINYYRKIAETLENIRFQETNRKKLRAVAEKLRNLQEKNTAKSLDHSLANDADLDSKVIEELANLSQKVREIDDLDSSFWLKEHIALFSDKNKLT